MKKEPFPTKVQYLIDLLIFFLIRLQLYEGCTQRKIKHSRILKGKYKAQYVIEVNRGRK